MRRCRGLARGGREASLRKRSLNRLRDRRGLPVGQRQACLVDERARPPWGFCLLRGGVGRQEESYQHRKYVGMSHVDLGLSMWLVINTGDTGSAVSCH